VIWDLDQGLVLQSVRIQSHATNQIVVNNFLSNEEEQDHIQFCTVGSQGHLTFWQYTYDENDLGFSTVEVD
jgi:O-acetylhomoserine/O-acetylserine sulfhydrylase-like pyridoxal-dependent enzyme